MLLSRRTAFNNTNLMCQMGLIKSSNRVINITLYKGMLYLGWPIHLCRGLSLINYSLTARLAPM